LAHFAVVLRGDAEGAESVRRTLHDWLCEMMLEIEEAAWPSAYPIRIEFRSLEEMSIT
jgi:hypothetical protein